MKNGENKPIKQIAMANTKRAENVNVKERRLASGKIVAHTKEGRIGGLNEKRKRRNDENEERTKGIYRKSHKRLGVVLIGFAFAFDVWADQARLKCGQ